MSNREVLFRGKRKDNREWVEGFYIKYGFTNREKPYIVQSYASDLYGFEVIPATVGQFTGLTDKNGKKIFEGDIVLAGSEGVMANCEVKRRIDGTYYMNLNAGTVWYMMPNRNGKTTVEVIGNIHDNSELLGGEGT